MFGPRVAIKRGDHRTGVVGVRIADVTEKLPRNDQDVETQDDVSSGSGAIILKGVTLGRGSIIVAGSVITHTIPEFSVTAAVQARVIRVPISDIELREHKRKLGL